MVCRLFVETRLSQDAIIVLHDMQYHYLCHVMRSQIGQDVLLFNGLDGEWSGEITKITKKEAELKLTKQTRLQSEEKISDVWLCFAPIKKDNMDFVIQKATELGVSVLQPVITRRTVIPKVNIDKMHAQAIEASEQCERLSVPMINPILSLDKLLADWDDTRTLYYLDERGVATDAITKEKVAYLVGPEGGFDEQEIKKLSTFKSAKSVHLGRRILRAETASVVILAIHNERMGWQ